MACHQNAYIFEEDDDYGDQSEQEDLDDIIQTHFGGNVAAAAAFSARHAARQGCDDNLSGDDNMQTVCTYDKARRMMLTLIPVAVISRCATWH